MMITINSSSGAARAADLESQVRMAHLDRDSGFLVVMRKRMERLGWEHRVLPTTVSPAQVSELPIDVLVVNLAILGPGCWDWLANLCHLDHEVAVVVCTDSAPPAQRVRGLRLGADDWISKPCHPEELIARVEAIVRVRRRSIHQPDWTPIVAGELT